MHRFYKNVLLMSIPAIFITLIIARYWVVGLFTGELINTDTVIENQRKNNYIIGMAYNEQTQYLKLENANYYEPELIAIGTSRVMQFKKDFFDCSFYNCGGAVSNNFDEYINFLENLDYTPKYLLLGLDVWVFNDNWNRNCVNFYGFEEIRLHKRSRRAIVKEIEDGFNRRKLNLRSLGNYHNSVGINACVKGNGFASDGSYVYRNTYQYPEKQIDYQFKDTYGRIARGDSRFEYCEHCDKDTYMKLDALLKYCHDRGIYVIGFLAPMAPSVCDLMVEIGEYNYIKEISPFCQDVFMRYGFEYYDYWNPSDIGIDDSFFVDGFHSSDIANAIMLVEMIHSNSELSKVCSARSLMEKVDARYSNLCFDNPFE